MPRLLADKTECFVSVFKEGALSRVGHDVMLKFQRCSLTVGDGLSMKAEFSVDSLRVVGALKDGRPQPGLLSPKDERDIAGNIAKVLEPARFPRATFVTSKVTETDDGYRIDGELTLHGVPRKLVVHAERSNGMATARVVLRQPDYGIKPFKALFGALRIKPEVAVEIRVPYDDG